MKPAGRALAAAVLAAAAGPALGQTTAYETTFGTGGYGTGNQSTASLQIPLSFRLRTVEEHRWGLRLRVPVTFGVTEFDEDSPITLDSIKTLAVVPMVEFWLPLDETWTLIPFVGVGAAHEFDSSVTEFLGNTGTKLRADKEWSENHFTFATALRYVGQIGSTGYDYSAFGRTEFGVDLYRRIGSNIGGNHLTPGVYSRAFLYWDDVTFVNPGTGAITISDEYELGLSIGTIPAIEVLGIGLPRTYVGYRFGDGLHGIRITFGEIL